MSVNGVPADAETNHHALFAELENADIIVLAMLKQPGSNSNGSGIQPLQGSTPGGCDHSCFDHFCGISENQPAQIERLRTPWRGVYPISDRPGGSIKGGKVSKP